jgi:hypothetical protein
LKERRASQHEIQIAFVKLRRKSWDAVGLYNFVVVSKDVLTIIIFNNDLLTAPCFEKGALSLLILFGKQTRARRRKIRVNTI